MSSRGFLALASLEMTGANGFWSNIGTEIVYFGQIGLSGPEMALLRQNKGLIGEKERIFKKIGC